MGTTYDGAAKKRTSTTTFPQSAARYAQAIPAGEFRNMKGVVSEADGAGVLVSSRFGAGTMYHVDRETGTGRTTCALCGTRIAKGAAALRCGYQSDDHHGYFVNKYHVHFGACPGEDVRR